MGCCVWEEIKEIKVLAVLQGGRKSTSAWVADSSRVAQGSAGQERARRLVVPGISKPSVVLSKNQKISNCFFFFFLYSNNSSFFQCYK